MLSMATSFQSSEYERKRLEELYRNIRENNKDDYGKNSKEFIDLQMT